MELLIKDVGKLLEEGLLFGWGWCRLRSSLGYLLRSRETKGLFPRSPQHLDLKPSSFPHHLYFSRLKFLYKVPSKKRIHSYKPRNQPSYKQHRNSQSHYASSTSRCPRVGILPHSDTISINPTFRPINTRLPSSFLTRR
jgi:hypothetical protein